MAHVMHCNKGMYFTSFITSFYISGTWCFLNVWLSILFRKVWRMKIKSGGMMNWMNTNMRNNSNNNSEIKELATITQVQLNWQPYEAFLKCFGPVDARLTRECYFMPRSETLWWQNLTITTKETTTLKYRKLNSTASLGIFPYI